MYILRNATEMKKSNDYTRGIMPKHVTSDRAYLYNLAPEQHSSKKCAAVASRWQLYVQFKQPGNLTPDLPHR